MKKNLMWVLLVCLLVALIVGASGLYNSLKDKVEIEFVTRSHYEEETV